MAVEKPTSIIWFNRLFLASAVVGVENILAHYGLLRGMAIAQGSSPAGPMLGIVLVLLEYLIFRYFIVRRGSNIARWAFVAVTAFSVAMVPLNFPAVFGVGRVYAAADIVSYVFELAAGMMLFRKDAVRWLRRDRTAIIET